MTPQIKEEGIINTTIVPEKSKLKMLLESSTSNVKNKKQSNKLVLNKKSEKQILFEEKRRQMEAQKLNEFIQNATNNIIEDNKIEKNVVIDTKDKSLIGDIKSKTEHKEEISHETDLNNQQNENKKEIATISLVVEEKKESDKYFIENYYFEVNTKTNLQEENMTIKTNRKYDIDYLKNMRTVIIAFYIIKF